MRENDRLDVLMRNMKECRRKSAARWVKYCRSSTKGPEIVSCGTRLIPRLLIVTERGVNRHGTLVSVTYCDSTIRGNFGITE